MITYANFKWKLKSYVASIKWYSLFKTWGFRNGLARLIEKKAVFKSPYSEECMKFTKIRTEERKIGEETRKVDIYENCPVIIEVSDKKVYPSPRKENIDKEAEFKQFRKEAGAYFPKTV